MSWAVAAAGAAKAAEYGSQMATNYVNYGISKKMARYNYKLARKMANYQDNLGRQLMMDSPSIQRRAMEHAGYNPILAATSGFQGYEMPSVTTPQASTPQMEGSFKFDPVTAKQLDRLDAETHNIDTDTRLKELQGKSEMLNWDRQALENESLAYSTRLENHENRARLAEWGDHMQYDGRHSTGFNIDSPFATYLRSDAARHLRSGYTSAFERSAFTNTKGHAEFEDTVNAVHGGSSAFSNIGTGYRFFRGRR